MSECKFCNMTPITDKFGGYNNYENIMLTEEERAKLRGEK
jgi:hypothetical protein